MWFRHPPAPAVQVDVDSALAEMRALTEALRDLTETLNRKKNLTDE